MDYFYGSTDFALQGPSAVTLGKFDGLHRGHQKLLECVKKQAKGNVVSVVFAFNAKKESLLLTEEEQRQFLEDDGIGCLVRCPFVPEISGMTPEQFVREILVKRLHAVYVAVGTDFRFGYQRKGDALMLRSLGERCGIQTQIIEKETWNGREISSTYVREAMAVSNMELVTNLMGRHWSLEGTVVHGAHLGTRLGMPTANLVPDGQKYLPPDGVYESLTRIEGDSQIHPGLTNIGCKPTVHGTYRGAETYLFDPQEALYGKKIRVSLLHFERPEKKFDSIGLLQEQIRQDIMTGREYFK